MLLPFENTPWIKRSLSKKEISLTIYPELNWIVFTILFSYGFMTIIWLRDPATNLCPYLEYRTVSQFFIGNWMLVVFNPSEQITNNFKPSLNPTATLKVRGCTSKLVGLSVKLKQNYHANILSKLVDVICSYLMAFILRSADKIKNSFLVGMRQISRIFWMSNVDVKTDWIGDRRVSTRVSWRRRLKTTGKSLPGGSLWFWIFCFISFISPFYLRYSDWIGMDKSYRSFSFTCTITQTAIVSWAKVIFTILWR